MSSDDVSGLATTAAELQPSEVEAASSPDRVEPAVEETNEEEDVAYDEEPDEVEAEAASGSVNEQDAQEQQVRTCSRLCALCAQCWS